MADTCVELLLNLCLMKASTLTIRLKIGEYLIREYCPCPPQRHNIGDYGGDVVVSC